MTSDAADRALLTGAEAAGLARSLLAEAAAGTGKTTSVVERVVALLRRGEDPAGLAVITFTEAAAAELRHRIRDAVRRAAAADPRLRDAEAALDRATITTLHAFALRILRQHAVEAGLPPDFEVTDEVEAAVDTDRSWRRFLDRLAAAEGEDRWALEVAIELGLSFSNLREVLRAFDGSYDRLEDLDPPPPMPPWDPTPVRGPLEEAIARLAHCRDPEDRLAVHLRSLEEVAGALSGVDGRAALAALIGAKLWVGKLGRRDRWACPVDEVRALLRDAEQARRTLLRSLADAATARLIALAARHVRDEARRRRQRGRLRFHDLLVCARDLLRDDPDVRRRLAARYRYLIIDEFQDTDPLQIDIAVRLAAADPDRADGDWRTVEVAEGRLTVVGDPKQSIYRFRRADIRVLHATRDRIPTHLTLRTNFRSVPDITDWVDAVFPHHMQPSATQAGYVPLEPHRPRREGTGVRWFGAPVPGSMPEVRAAQAADVARVVVRIVDEGWEVERGGAWQPARWQDVAILVRRHATVRLLERALEDAGVPYRIAASTLLFDTEEVRTLIALGAAVLDPTDEVATVAALRALGCHDRDLLEWAGAGGRWHRLEVPAGLPEDHPAVVAAGWLARLRDQRWPTSAPALMEQLTEELMLLAAARAHRRARDRWRRLRYIAQLAHQHHQQGATAHDFLRWLAGQAAVASRVDDHVEGEPDDDAVVITTIHAAKGLEFPIVVALSWDTRPPTNRGPVVWTEGGCEVQLRGGNGIALSTAGYGEAAGAEKDAAWDEEVRLAYVAATRARDHLLVAVHHKDGEDPGNGTLAAWLWAHHQELPWTALDLTGAVATPAAAGVAVGAPAASAPSTGRPAGDGLPIDLDRWLTARSWRADAARPTTVAATTLVAAVADATEDTAAVGGDGAELSGAAADVAAAEDAAVWRRGRAGTSVGRAVHAVLQVCDLATGADIPSLAAAYAEIEGIPGAAGTVAGLADAGRRARTVASAVASGRYRREVHVGAPVPVTGGVAVLEGFIDLLWDTDDGWVVVDYKTDQVRGDPEEAVARYRPQAAAYALAVQAATGRPVRRCVFVLTRTPDPAEVVIEDAELRAVVEEVRGRLPEHVRVLPAGVHAGARQEGGP